MRSSHKYIGIYRCTYLQYVINSANDEYIFLIPDQKSSGFKISDYLILFREIVQRKNEKRETLFHLFPLLHHVP